MVEKGKLTMVEAEFKEEAEDFCRNFLERLRDGQITGYFLFAIGVGEEHQMGVAMADTAFHERFQRFLQDRMADVKLPKEALQ